MRNTAKGEKARASIEESTGRKRVVEVWELNLSSYQSVQAFAKRAEGLERVDVLLENAGLMNLKFGMAEADESTVTTNVVSTFLLALLMLPKLRETAQRFNTAPRITVVSSELHFMAKFEEGKEEGRGVFEALRDEKRADMGDRYVIPCFFFCMRRAGLADREARYGTTKLLEILLARELAQRIQPSPGAEAAVIVNTLTPGACKSDFFREAGFISRTVMTIIGAIIARTTEVGSRTLVAAASSGQESHGRYMADGVVSTESPWVLSEEGKRVGERVWRELMEDLERVNPGIGENI